MAPDPFFFLLNLEARMNLWHVVFYIAVAVALYRVWKERKHLLSFLRRAENRLPVLCVCLVLPVALLLTVAQGAHDWYTAPVLPFVAVLIALFIWWTIAQWRPVRWVWLGLALFTGFRHVHYLATPERRLQGMFSLIESVRGNDTLWLRSPPRQHLYLYSLWHGKYLQVMQLEQLKQSRGRVAIVEESWLQAVGESSVTRIYAARDYSLVRIQ